MTPRASNTNTAKVLVTARITKIIPRRLEEKNTEYLMYFFWQVLFESLKDL